MVATKDHNGPTYLRAIRKEISRARNPYTPVPKAMAYRYGAEKPSADTLDPNALANKTLPWATNRKGRPEHGGSNGKMIVQVAGPGPLICLGLTVLIKAAFPKTLIGRLIVMYEIEVVFDERGAGVGIVANTIASDPRVQKRKRQKKKDEQDPFEPVLLVSELRFNSNSIRLREDRLQTKRDGTLAVGEFRAGFTGSAPYKASLQERAKEIADRRL